MDQTVVVRDDVSSIKKDIVRSIRFIPFYSLVIHWHLEF